LLQALCASCHAVKTNHERVGIPLVYDFDWYTGKMLPKRVIEIHDLMRKQEKESREVDEDDVPF
jgi:hypothetical protein